VKKHHNLIWTLIALLLIVIWLSGCKAGSEPPSPQAGALEISQDPATVEVFPGEVQAASPIPPHAPEASSESPAVDPDRTQQPASTPEATPMDTVPDDALQPVSAERIWPEPPEKFPKGQVTHYDLVLIYNNKELFLDMPKEDFLHIIDCPVSGTEINDAFDDFLVETVFFEDNTEAFFFDSHLSMLTVYSDKYVTPRGLRVGDSVDKLMDLYGKPASAYNGEYSYEYYLDEYDLFRVTAENGVITSICINLAC